MLVDTHCHLNFNAFDDDREWVIARAETAGVRQIIVPAINLQTCHEAIQLAEYSQAVFAAVGIHPNDTADIAADDLSQIEELAAHRSVVAIGEIGLDYYWDKSPKAGQMAVLEKQLAIAAKLNLPVIIHNRESTADVLSMLESWSATLSGQLKEHPGVMHSFSGNTADAERALKAGFYLGFTGPITYKNAEETRRIAEQAPLDRILIETDAPFLTPQPYRGKRNEPAYVDLVARKIAHIRGLDFEQVATATTENAHRLFRFTEHTT